MRSVSKLIYGKPRKFEFIGQPLRLRGPGHLLSVSIVDTFAPTRGAAASAAAAADKESRPHATLSPPDNSTPSTTSNTTTTSTSASTSNGNGDNSSPVPALSFAAAAADPSLEPMRIHCIPGYTPVLYLVEYPRRRELLLLDAGCPSDVARVRYYVEEVLGPQRAAEARGLREVEEKSATSSAAAAATSEKTDGSAAKSTPTAATTTAGDAPLPPPPSSTSSPLTLEGNLKLVVATHCHADHSGGLGGYCAAGIPHAAATDMQTSYVGPRRRLSMLTEIFITTVVAHLLGRRPENFFLFSSNSPFGPYWRCPPPRTATLLADGDALPAGFSDWRAVKIPGHTSHMIALYHAPSRILYAADLTVMLSKGLFPPQSLHYPDAYTHTLARVRELDVRYLLLPHGGVVDVGAAYGSWHALLDRLGTAFAKQRAAAAATAAAAEGKGKGKGTPSPSSSPASAAAAAANDKTKGSTKEAAAAVGKGDGDKEARSRGENTADAGGKNSPAAATPAAAQDQSQKRDNASKNSNDNNSANTNKEKKEKGSGGDADLAKRKTSRRGRALLEFVFGFAIRRLNAVNDESRVITRAELQALRPPSSFIGLPAQTPPVPVAVDRGHSS